MAGLPHGRVVLVEQLAVGEDEADVVDEFVAQFVHVGVQLLLDGVEIHGRLDDLFVRGKLLGIHGLHERPSVFQGLHFRDHSVANGQVFVHFTRFLLLCGRRG